MLIRWACMVLVMLVAGLFAYVALRVKAAQTRAVKALAALACPGCGRVFGEETAEKLRLEANAATQQRLADARARGVQVRLDGRWRFACPDCGKALVFNPDAGTVGLDATPAAASPVAAAPAGGTEGGR